MLLLEKNGVRKKILRLLFYAGVLLSTGLAYSLFYYTADVKVMGNHVMYSIDTPDSFKSFTNIIYFLTAVLPPFLSSVKKTWLIGIVLMLSYIIAKTYYDDFIISIWCYFATMISLVILYIAWKSKEQSLENSH
jgi:hypothetical protein